MTNGEIHCVGGILDGQLAGVGARAVNIERADRRSRKKPDELAYYIVFATAETTLAELAAVAGLRWTVETCFETAKDELGLDHCEARSWHAWHRHMSLVLSWRVEATPVGQKQSESSFGSKRRLMRLPRMLRHVLECWDMSSIIRPAP